MSADDALSELRRDIDNEFSHVTGQIRALQAILGFVVLRLVDDDDFRDAFRDRMATLKTTVKDSPPVLTMPMEGAVSQVFLDGFHDNMDRIMGIAFKKSLFGFDDLGHDEHNNTPRG